MFFPWTLSNQVNTETVFFACSDWLLKLRLSSAIHWFTSMLKQQVMPNMFMNKLETKSNGVLIRMVSIQKEFPIHLEEMSLQKLNKGLHMLYLSAKKHDG